MSIISQLSDVERSELEGQAGRLYIEIQRLLEEHNEVSSRLRTAGIVPQVSLQLNGWISLDPFAVQDLGSKLMIRTSYYRRPPTKRGKELWDQSAIVYGRPPDVAHRTAQGYIAVFARMGAMPLYVNEGLQEVHGVHGVCRFAATSLEDLRRAFGSKCPSWAKPSVRASITDMETALGGHLLSATG